MLLTLIVLPTMAQGPACSHLHRPSELKVAVVQFPITENQTPEQFYTKAENYVRQAKHQGNTLVVLPELVVLDLIRNPSHESWETQLLRVAREVTPVFFERMGKLAQELDISILAGTSPRIVGNDILNTALLAFPNGKKILQDKIFPTPDEIEWNWKGGNAIKVFDAPWGKTAILICHDCEFPVLSHAMAEYKPEVILVPSMTSDRSGLHRVQWTAQARAIEHYAYVIHTGTTQAGAEPYFGQASIISPQEPAFPTEVIRGEPNSDQMIQGTIDLQHLRTERARARIYPARTQGMRLDNSSVTWAQPE